MLQCTALDLVFAAKLLRSDYVLNQYQAFKTSKSAYILIAIKLNVIVNIDIDSKWKFALIAIFSYCHDF